MNLFVTIASISGQRKLWLSRSSPSARTYVSSAGESLLWSLDICCSSVTRVAARRSERASLDWPDLFTNTTFPRSSRQSYTHRLHIIHPVLEFVLSRLARALSRAAGEVRPAVNPQMYEVRPIGVCENIIFFFQKCSDHTLTKSCRIVLESVNIAPATLKSNNLKTTLLPQLLSFLPSVCCHLYYKSFLIYEGYSLNSTKFLRNFWEKTHQTHEKYDEQVIKGKRQVKTQMHISLTLQYS